MSVVASLQGQKTFRHILFAGALIAFPLNATELTKKECPSDPEMRSQALRKEGTSGNVTWISLAIPEKVGSQQFCYERTVTVPQATYVHWPLAGIFRLFVKDTITTANCCWPGARTERGILEYGSQRRRVETDVYRGQGEPGADTLWASAHGSVWADGKSVPIHVLAMTYNARAYNCYREVTNSGADVVASFQPQEGSSTRVFLKAGATVGVPSPNQYFLVEPAEAKKKGLGTVRIFLPTCDTLSWPIPSQK